MEKAQHLHFLSPPILPKVMKQKILIIEDEESILLALEDALTIEGFIVEVETDGIKGFEKGLDESYDIILLDIMLPRMNGFDICKG